MPWSVARYIEYCGLWVMYLGVANVFRQSHAMKNAV